MSSLRKMAEAKKAAILAEAQKRAAEIDQELAELERLASKYGLSVVEAAASREAAAAAPSMSSEKRITLVDAVKAVSDTIAGIHDASLTAKARAASEAYIRAKNRPATLGELHEMLEANGIKFLGDSPRNTLSAILGQTPTLYSISRDKGWWLKDVPVPELSGSLFRRV